MSRPDEGLIHQWLDGECTPEESARLEQLVATDPEWAAAVAEARGLIAASSRIVQSLDAVPRAMPAGSVAAPRLPAKESPRRSVMQPWLRIAAAVVLVAGTAYVLREQATEPFVPSASVDTQAPAAAPPAVVPEADVGPVQAPASNNASGAAATTVTERPVSPPPAAPVALDPAVVATPAPSVAAAGAAAPTRAAEEERRLSVDAARSRTGTVEMQRRARMVAEAPRGAVTRAADAPSAAPPETQVFLEGCWRVSAPPELVGVLNAPVIRRQHGDTLVLVTVRGDVVVQRSGDLLQGGLVARAEPCRE